MIVKKGKLFNEREGNVFQVIEEYCTQDENNHETTTLVHDQILSLYNQYFDPFHNKVGEYDNKTSVKLPITMMLAFSMRLRSFQKHSKGKL